MERDVARHARISEAPNDPLSVDYVASRSYKEKCERKFERKTAFQLIDKPTGKKRSRKDQHLSQGRDESARLLMMVHESTTQCKMQDCSSR